MKRLITAVFALALSVPSALVAQQRERGFDYFAPQREMVQRGVQAILQCNGLFTSNRTIEQVFEQELAYLRDPIGTAEGGDYEVDWDLKAVAIGAEGDIPVMRAAFREGIGCVIMAPDQTFADIDDLPILDTPPLPGDAATLAWPDGDLVEERPLPAEIDAEALQAASDWAFDRESPEQVTLSLIVVYDGEIVLERYAPGVDMTTKTRTWSTAKSLAVTLMGMLIDEGRMALDEPLGIEWLPARAAS
ncbi:MAG: serine hydrolase, partial [Gemmatimonadota bacterium]